MVNTYHQIYLQTVFAVKYRNAMQFISGLQPRIKIRGYKIIRAYGTGLAFAIRHKKMIQKLLDKIFQPFFTTKPTGQGTGLGLSLSYDIIKSHGGTINVETKQNEGLSAGKSGTAFIISLPINKTS